MNKKKNSKSHASPKIILIEGNIQGGFLEIANRCPTQYPESCYTMSAAISLPSLFTNLLARLDCVPAYEMLRASVAVCWISLMVPMSVEGQNLRTGKIRPCLHFQQEKDALFTSMLHPIMSCPAMLQLEKKYPNYEDVQVKLAHWHNLQ